MSESEHQKSANRKIKQWIENERRIVTYREISREVGCSVSEGKNILLSYFSSNPSSYPTYLLTGPLRSQATLAQTQLPTDRPVLDAKSLAALAGTQRVRIVDMDEVSDGERNSEEGLSDDEMQVENDEGAEDGIAGARGLRGVGGDPEVVVRPEEVVRRGVVLVGMEGLEEKMDLFEPGECHVHIYSLSAARVKDPAQYLISSLALRNHAKYIDAAKYHTITGDAFAPAAVPKPGPMKDGGMEFGKASKEAPNAAKGKDDKAAKAKEETKPTTAKKEAPSSAPAPAPAKAAEPTKAKPAPAESSKALSASTSGATGSARAASSSKKKRVITSDDEDESVEAEKSAQLAPPSEKADEEEGPSSSMVRAADDHAAMEAMMGMDVDDDFDMGAEDAASPKKASGKAKARKSDAQASGEGKKEGGRKKRRVKKTEMTIDEKGYTVAKDIYVEESCSGSEADDPVKPTAKKNAGAKNDSRQSSVSLDEDRRKSTSGAPAGNGSSAPKPKPPANKPGVPPPAKGQSTLAGFFKRK